MKSKKILIVLGVILALVIACFVYLMLMISPVDKNDKNTEIITVSQGSGSSQIATTLEEKGLIKSAFVFKIKAKLGGYDGTFKAGQYAISKSMSMKEQMELIKSGKTAGRLITIPDGNTIGKDSKIIDKVKGLSADAFIKEAETGTFDYKFLEGIPKRANRLEGFLYPDTYQVSLKATPHEIIDTMLKRFDNVFTDEYYNQAKEMKRSVLEIMTVASIVEREAKTPEDKKNVASVIYNRLKINMPLQMDSILAYITGEEKIKASLADTQVKSEYNPYTNKGLPPGPICSPGKESIEAALYPADTEYLYFVATDKLDGTNVFSKDYDDFLKNKAAFDKAYKEYIKKHPDKK